MLYNSSSAFARTVLFGSCFTSSIRLCRLSTRNDNSRLNFFTALLSLFLLAGTYMLVSLSYLVQMTYVVLVIWLASNKYNFVTIYLTLKS